MDYENEIVKKLKQHYSANEFAMKNRNDPFRVLISCILSLRTKDEVTDKASQRLFKKANNPKKLMNLDLKKIEKLIYPVGFYITKAKRIKIIAKQLHEDYNDKVPSTIAELLKFKGVGRKTANIVLVYGYNKLGMAVDTHVHRISNRLGWVNTKKPDDTEQELRKNLAKKHWLAINELMVKHGQNICRPISPFCSKCFIKEFCKRKNVKRSR